MEDAAAEEERGKCIVLIARARGACGERPRHFVDLLVR